MKKRPSVNRNPFGPADLFTSLILSAVVAYPGGRGWYRGTPYT